MEYATTNDYRELSWMDVEPERFPYGLDELIAANRTAAGQAPEPAFDGTGTPITLKMPLSRQMVFSDLGLMLGIFPPATIFLSILFFGRERSLMLILVMVLANATTALVGYRFGAVVSRMINYIEQQTTGEYVILSVFIGALWGIVSGGLGGLFLFLIGGIAGAVIGGFTAAIALPVFLIPYNAVRQGGSMGLSHFMPVAVGINAVICAGILNLALR